MDEWILGEAHVEKRTSISVRIALHGFEYIRSEKSRAYMWICLAETPYYILSGARYMDCNLCLRLHWSFVAKTHIYYTLSFYYCCLTEEVVNGSLSACHSQQQSFSRTVR